MEGSTAVPTIRTSSAQWHSVAAKTTTSTTAHATQFARPVKAGIHRRFERFTSRGHLPCTFSVCLSPQNVAASAQAAADPDRLPPRFQNCSPRLILGVRPFLSLQGVCSTFAEAWMCCSPNRVWAQQSDFAAPPLPSPATSIQCAHSSSSSVFRNSMRRSLLLQAHWGLVLDR